MTILYSQNFEATIPPDPVPNFVGGTLPTAPAATGGGAAGFFLSTATSPLDGSRSFAMVGAGDGSAMLYTGVSTADTDVTVLFGVTEQSGGLPLISLIARADSGFQNGYYARIDDQRGNVAILKMVAGVATWLSVIGGESSLNIGYPQSWWARFQVQSDALRFRAWESGTTEPATWLINITDSTFTAPGYAGFAVSSATNGLSAPFVVDDFSIADFSSDAFTVGPLTCRAAGPSIELATTTLGGATKTYTLYGQTTPFTANGTQTVIATNGTGSFTYTPGDDLLRYFAIGTTDGVQNAVYTDVVPGARQAPAAVWIAIGDSITAGPDGTSGSTWTQASTSALNPVAVASVALASYTDRPVTGLNYSWGGTQFQDWIKGSPSPGNAAENRNFPGHTGYDMYSQALADGLAAGVQCVVLALGTNNATADVPTFTTLATNMVNNLKADYPSNVPILIRLIPPVMEANGWNESFEQLNPVLASLADGQRVFVILNDFWQAGLSNATVWWTPTTDVVHPNYAGFAALGNYMSRDLYRFWINPDFPSPAAVAAAVWSYGNRTTTA